jgi:hypothetical protein
MRPTERIQLIINIAQTITEKYQSDDDIRHLFELFHIDSIKLDGGWNNEYTINTKQTLQTLDDELLKNIASELDVPVSQIFSLPPKNWENTTGAKAFISHTSENRQNARRLREALSCFNVDAFVAHEDIKPSEEWEKEIDKALKTMDFFVSLHTAGFNESVWCQQEVGYAAARDVKIIPIKFDGQQDPAGFIGKIQAFPRSNKKAENIAQEIIDILKTDSKTKTLYDEKLKTRVDDIEAAPF